MGSPITPEYRALIARFAPDPDDDGENHCPECDGIMHEVRFDMRTGESLWKCEDCGYVD